MKCIAADFDRVLHQDFVGDFPVDFFAALVFEVQDHDDARALLGQRCGVLDLEIDELQARQPSWLPGYRVRIRDGLLYGADGAPFDTRDAYTHWSGRGRAIFVMHGDGAIYCAPEHRVGEFHHSSLGQGKPVAGAGELEAREGRLLAITDHSSHYCPPRRFTEQVLAELAAGGVDLRWVTQELRY